MASQPWYTYPQDQPGGGYGEILDPVCQSGGCNYLKPDTNIAVPSGTPITALLPGTVTDVSSRGTGNGGLSVTVKLDNALNSLAQYVSYNFLGGTNVRVGQRVNAGQQVGTAGSPTGINFALALGNSPSWGSGAGFQYNATGNPLLDPRQLLSKFTSTGNGGNGGGGGGSSSTYPATCPPFDIACGMASLFSSNTVRQVGLLFIALILLLVGLQILFFGGKKEES